MNMKKNLKIFALAFGVISMLCTLQVKAAVQESKADYEAKGLSYYIKENTSSVSVKITSGKSAVDIPETVFIEKKEYTVTELLSNSIPHDSIIVESKYKKVGRDAKEYVKNNKTQTINIPKTVKKIEKGAFSYYSKLKKINVAEENPVYMSTEKGLFSKNGKILYAAVQGTGTYKVRKGVEVIADRAFVATKYEKVILPESCYKVGSRAFFKCSKLKQVQGKSFCVCGNYAFYGTKVKGTDRYGTMKFAI